MTLEDEPDAVTDPAPQHQEQITQGWAPPPDKEAAWREKWNLTR